MNHTLLSKLEIEVIRLSIELKIIFKIIRKTLILLKNKKLGIARAKENV
tara:strand:- start:287 stop:433 length:147 start_codon:yes stop_codon:yes gene_type:complete